MNDETEPPLDPLDAQLLALLDGDLEEEQRELLEKRLVAEPELRKRLRDLQRSWEILGEIPHKTVDHRFASTTVEMIVTRATQELETLPLALHGGRKGKWTLMLACLAAFLLGGISIAAYRWLVYYKELHDLEVVAHLDALRQVDDVAFLQDLAQNDAWEKHIAVGTELDRIRRQERANLSAVALRQRPAALQELPDSQRSRVKIDWDDWSRFPPARKQELRQRYQEIVSQPNGEKLLLEADRYAAWLEALSPTESSRIATVPANQRAQHITEQFAAIEKDWSERADDQHIREFVSSLIAEWETNPPPFLERIRNEMLKESEKAPSLRELVSLFFSIRWRERGPHLEPLISTILTPDQKQRLLAGLSDSTKQKSPEELHLYLGRHISTVMRDWLVPRDNIEDFLRKVYSNLPAQKREIIDLSSPDTLKRRMDEFTYSRFGPGPGPARPSFGGGRPEGGRPEPGRGDGGRPEMGRGDGSRGEDGLQPPADDGVDRSRRLEFRDGPPPFDRFPPDLRRSDDSPGKTRPPQ
jgi:hypothetical protein